MARTVLEVVVAGDSRSLERSMARSSKSVDKFGKDADRSLKKTESGFKGVGAAAKVAGGFLVGGVVASGFKKFAAAATDVSESLSKNRVLFGQHARSVEAFSKTSAKSFGTSRRAALEYTGVFGNLFRSLGLTQKASADNSVALTKLAADMASFNNTSVEDALEAIRSGLVGETEPLRRFGVNMNDATLRAEALRKGLVKTTKESLDPQTKALAALSLVTKQTKNAHGDFARTSGGLANQQRILNAQLEDSAAALGAKLVPAALAGVGAMTGLISAMSQIPQSSTAMAALGAAVGGLTAHFGRLAVLAVGAKFAEMATGMRAAGGAMAALNVAIRANPIGLLATVVGTVVGALVGFSGANRDAKTSADDLTNAIDRQREAAKRLADLDIEAAQRKANVKTANAQLAAAERELTAARAAGDPTRVKQAEAGLAQAKVSATRATRELKRTEEDATRVRRDAKKATDDAANATRGRISTLTSERNKTRDVKNAIRDQIQAGKDAGASQEQLAPLQREYTRLKEKDAKQSRAIAAAMKDIPKEVRARVIVKFSLAGVSGFLNDVGKIGAESFGSPAGDLPAAMNGAVGGVLSRAGARFKKSPAASAGTGGASDPGGKLGGLTAAARGVFSRVARTFGGVRITSGRRSRSQNAAVGGDPNSDHLTGDALDLVPSEGWNPRSIARFDRIASWARGQGLFVGWRGLPNHGPGNHLHLSYRGRRGPGGRDIGDPKGKYGLADLKGLAMSVGLGEHAASVAAAVGMAESGGNPRAMGRNSNGTVDRGLWQINSIHRDSTFSVAGNAKAMARISKGGRNFQPWAAYSGPDFRGSDGPWRRFFAAAKRATPKAGRKGRRLSKMGASGLVPLNELEQRKADTLAEIAGYAPTGSDAGSGDFGGDSGTGGSGGGGGSADVFAAGNASLAMARLTDATDDDLKALRWLEAIAEEQLRNAHAAGDSDGIASSAATLKGFRDDIRALTEAVDTNTQAQLEQAQAIIALKDQALKESIDRERLGQTELGLWKRAIADITNTTLGGRIGLGYQTPGFAGGGARY